jgi:hypothetical protein
MAGGAPGTTAADGTRVDVDTFVRNVLGGTVDTAALGRARSALAQAYPNGIGAGDVTAALATANQAAANQAAPNQAAQTAQP